MKTIIETDGYPVRVILVPETDEDRKAIQVLTENFWDENSDTVVAHADTDEAQEYGEGALTITAWCNLT